MTDPEQIASRLTKAQRWYVVQQNRPLIFWGKGEQVTWRQLQRRGLAGDATLTPLGKRVRAIIERDSNGK